MYILFTSLIYLECFEDYRDNIYSFSIHCISLILFHDCIYYDTFRLLSRVDLKGSDAFRATRSRIVGGMSGIPAPEYLKWLPNPSELDIVLDLFTYLPPV